MHRECAPAAAHRIVRLFTCMVSGMNPEAMQVNEARAIGQEAQNAVSLLPDYMGFLE